MNEFFAAIPTNVKLGIAGGAAIFMLGSCAGSAMTTPEVEFVEVTGPTKTVTEPAPDPITEYVLPPDCADALRISERIGASANNIYKRGDAQVELISRARQTLADQGDLSAVENDQRDLSGDIIGDLSNLSGYQYSYDVAFEACQEAMQ